MRAVRRKGGPRARHDGRDAGAVTAEPAHAAPELGYIEDATVMVEGDRVHSGQTDLRVTDTGHVAGGALDSVTFLEDS